jgi:hypothetical protein
MLAPAPGRSHSGQQTMIQFLTDAGKAAVDAYDTLRDDPTFRCSPVGVRRAWGAPGTPLSITREGNRVIIRHEWMDIRRVVDLDQREHPKDATRATLGHSIGHFEGDTLVSHTANYAPGVLNQYVEQQGQPTRGLLHSAALTTVERLRLDAARQRLVVEITPDDPQFFTRAFEPSTLEYAPSDLKLEPFRCAPRGVDGAEVKDRPRGCRSTDARSGKTRMADGRRGAGVAPGAGGTDPHLLPPGRSHRRRFICRAAPARHRDSRLL